MTQTHITSRRFATPVVVIISMIWMLPLLLTGSWYDSHEYYRYPWLAQEFSAALKSGILYPRWLPDINGGYGYPTFVFYQPAFFYLASFFTFFFSDVIHACYGAVWVIFLGGMAGAYRLCRLWAGRDQCLVFALIFLSTPYVLFNYLARGDLSEVMAMMIVPWQLHCLLRIEKRAAVGKSYGKRALVLAGLVALQCYSHMFVAAPMVGVLAVLAGFIWWQHGRDALLGRVLLASLMGGVIAAAPHWWVLVQMKPYVNYAAALSDRYVTTNNLHNSAELLVQHLRLPFFLGLYGFWLARHERFMRLACGLMIAFFVMTHSVSRIIWEHVKLLDYLQFPWRFYGIIASLQLIGIAQLVRLRGVLGAKRADRELVGMLSIHLIIASAFIIWPAPLDFETVRNYLPWQHETLNNRREFDPITMHNIAALPDRRRIPIPVVMNSEGGAGVWLGISFEGLPHNIQFTVRSGAYNKRQGALPDIIVNQLYFPGWKARVNGTQIGLVTPQTPPNEPALNYDANGRILVRLPADGRYDVDLWYDGPPYWLLRNVLIVLCLGGLVAWVRRPDAPKRLLQSVKKGIFQDAS